MRFPVVNLGAPPGTEPCIPGAIRLKISLEEGTMRQEAARMDRANQMVQDAYRRGDYDSVNQWSKTASDSSKRWQEARDRKTRLFLELEACEARLRVPVATPSRYRSPATVERPPRPMPPVYPPVTTPGSRPVGMRFPTIPFGNLFSQVATISPVSMISPAGPAGLAV